MFGFKQSWVKVGTTYFKSVLHAKHRNDLLVTGPTIRQMQLKLEQPRITCAVIYLINKHGDIQGRSAAEQHSTKNVLVSRFVVAKFRQVGFLFSHFWQWPLFKKQLCDSYQTDELVWWFSHEEIRDSNILTALCSSEHMGALNGNTVFVPVQFGGSQKWINSQDMGGIRRSAPNC